MSQVKVNMPQMTEYAITDLRIRLTEALSSDIDVDRYVSHTVEEIESLATDGLACTYEVSKWDLKSGNPLVIQFGAEDFSMLEIEMDWEWEDDADADFEAFKTVENSRRGFEHVVSYSSKGE